MRAVVARRVANAVRASISRAAVIPTARWATPDVLAPAATAFQQTMPALPFRSSLSPVSRSVRAFSAAASYPSHQVLPMPSLSPTMTQGQVAGWKMAVGDKVSAGDILCDIQTDKATMEMESMEDGYLAKILVAAGDTDIPVGQAVAIMVDTAEDVAAFANFTQADVGPEEAPPPTDAPGKEPTRAIVERPDIRPTVNQGKPLRTSRAPSNVEVAQPAEAGSEMVTVRDALNKAMEEEMERDDRVYVIGEEVGEYQGAYKITRGLLQKFGPQRVRDTPITEAGFTGLGVGSAMAGLKPIVEFMTFNFAMQAIDHIINSAAKTLYMSAGQIQCAMVFRGPNGAASGVGAQHSQCFAAWYMQVPGLKVLAPWSAEDARGLMKAAIRDPDPVVFLENELLYGEAFPMSKAAQDKDWTVPIGKAKCELVGEDLSIVTFSKCVGLAMKAAEILAAEGINVEVINLRTLRPIDREAIGETVRKTHRLMTLEEGWPSCGVGSEIVAITMELAFDSLDAPPERIAGAEIPMPYAINLERQALPSIDDIVNTARKLVNHQI
jgi:pyruvate dehydrogenase E1 component beta subunit